MLTLGIKIGSNDSLVSSLGLFGFRCLFTSVSAILFSILFTVLLEKTILPLEEVRRKLICQNTGINQAASIEDKEEANSSPLIWIMPTCIILGILTGNTMFPLQFSFILNYTLTGSLIILYTGVGISFGMNRSVFQYIRILSWKIVLISAAIIAGSLTGGYISGIILGVPTYITASAAGGMSYYSITGAYLTQIYGIEVGAYGFLVNVMREFLTVILLPVLIKISPGSPIASGAAGNMDTMLVPITKFTGAELGIVTLITGTILTFIVPFLLPVLVSFFSL
jgi:uncharacterized membrane protein YbjE (DUF340 family)